MPGRLGFLNFPFLSTLSLRRATLSGSSRATVLVFLSTLSLRRATQSGALPQPPPHISIHALLAESDNCRPYHVKRHENFYPRSPCGERRETMPGIGHISYFYPRSPCGERPEIAKISNADTNFYPRSPCGERRGNSQNIERRHNISIHALLAESD